MNITKLPTNKCRNLATDGPCNVEDSFEQCISHTIRVRRVAGFSIGKGQNRQLYRELRGRHDDDGDGAEFVRQNERDKNAFGKKVPLSVIYAPCDTVNQLVS